MVLALVYSTRFKKMVIGKNSVLSAYTTVGSSCAFYNTLQCGYIRKLMDNYPLKPRLIYAHDTYPRTSIVRLSCASLAWLKVSFQSLSGHTLAKAHSIQYSAVNYSSWSMTPGWLDMLKFDFTILLCSSQDRICTAPSFVISCAAATELSEISTNKLTYRHGIYTTIGIVKCTFDLGK